MARAGPSVASLLSQLDLGSYATKLGDLGYKFASCVAHERPAQDCKMHPLDDCTAGT